MGCSSSRARYGDSELYSCYVDGQRRERHILPWVATFLFYFCALVPVVAADRTRQNQWMKLHVCVTPHLRVTSSYSLSALNHRSRPWLEFESCFQCLINHLVVNHTRAFLSGLFVSRPNAEDNGGLHWACALPPTLTYNINQLRVVVVCPAPLKSASGRFSGLLTERLLSGTSGEWVGQHKQIKQILLFTSRNESVMASSVAQGKPHCHHDDYFPKRNITGLWEEQQNELGKTLQTAYSEQKYHSVKIRHHKITEMSRKWK